MGFHLRIRFPFYFTPDFCLSQDMDAALPPLTAEPSPKHGGYGLASSTLYLVATPCRSRLFPLTLTLSLGERGQPAAFAVYSADRPTNTTLEIIQAAGNDSPSPTGRGQG